jgi:putative transposase
MNKTIDQEKPSAHAPNGKKSTRTRVREPIENTWMRQRSSVSRLCVHFTWCTKYRQKILTNGMAATLRTVIRSVANELGLRIVAFETESDHVHLVLWYPPAVSLSTIMRRIKGASSRELGRMPQWSRLTRFPDAKAVWAPSFSASSCEGMSVKRLKRYVSMQAPRLSEDEILVENARRRAEKKVVRSRPTDESEGLGLEKLSNGAWSKHKTPSG